MKDKLNDAVVLEGRQRNHFTGCSDDDPKGGMLEEVHGWSADTNSLWLLALAANAHLQSPDAPFKI
jgi:hypothetical protein